MQTDATLLDATGCLCLQTLLHVVASWWELMHLFSHHCQHKSNNSQLSWSNNVGSCCVHLPKLYNEIPPSPFVLFRVLSLAKWPHKGRIVPIINREFLWSNIYQKASHLIYNIPAVIWDGCTHLLQMTPSYNKPFSIHCGAHMYLCTFKSLWACMLFSWWSFVHTCLFSSLCHKERFQWKLNSLQIHFVTKMFQGTENCFSLF